MPSVNQVSSSNRTAIISVLLVFLISLSTLAYIYYSFPNLEEDEKKFIKLPRDLEDAKNLGNVLDHYKDKYYFQVLLVVCFTYMFLQTFAIPGSISLSIISGFLFPFPLALLLVSFCSATGAALCYMISFFVGRSLIQKYFPEKAEKYSALVEKHKDDIFNYMLFLRVTPILPNWFINISAPIINVPIVPFWIGTFFGVMPPSFLAIKTGAALHEMTYDSNSSLSITSMLVLAGLAILSLVPILLRNKLKQKFE